MILAFSLLLIVPVQVFSFQNLQFKSISASNDQMYIRIQFGELGFTTKPKQSLESVTIGYGATEFRLLNPQLRVYPHSFTIVSIDDGVYIKAKNRIADVYDVDVFIYGNDLYKQSLSGTINEPKEAELALVPDYTPQRNLQDLVMLVKHDDRNFWKEYYSVNVKVFDKSVNPNPKFEDWYGLVKNAKIKVDAISEDKTKTFSLDGNTGNYGTWEGKYYISDNFKTGKYNVTITATQDNTVISNTLQTYIFALVETDKSPQVP